ncbi:MAG: alcohol dehydrogenase catalytic domain-containing protein [Victivallales bacterium]|nr:alcohol dehydrogenase catalytic domain-containing protein [Victivallales bacterium]
MKIIRSMRLTGVRRLEMQEVPQPQISADDEVLIKVTDVGVCGSDVHYYRHGRIGSQVVKYPFTVGHEGAGIVEAVGAAVSRVKPGDRIAIEPATPCHQCDQCLAGREHTCRNLLYLGCPGQIEGCLSDYIVMKEHSCFPLSEKLTLEEGALSEPLSIGVYAVKLSGMTPGMKIGILGCGPIGLCVLMPARAQGADKIYVTDKLDYRLECARKAGADWAGNPLSLDVAGAVAETEPNGLDLVFECCGQAEAVNDALKLLKPGGKLMQIGIPDTDTLAFNMDYMRRKEICVQNVRRQNRCVQAALDMIARRDFDVNIMASHRFPLAETQTAFELVENYQDGVIKAIIKI